MQSFSVTRTLQGHEHEVSDVAYISAEDNDLLLSCSRDMTIKLWDT